MGAWRLILLYKWGFIRNFTIISHLQNWWSTLTSFGEFIPSRWSSRGFRLLRGLAFGPRHIESAKKLDMVFIFLRAWVLKPLRYAIYSHEPNSITLHPFMISIRQKSEEPSLVTLPTRMATDLEWRELPSAINFSFLVLLSQKLQPSSLMIRIVFLHASCDVLLLLWG